jgi:tRNA(adenine34) deaminase
MKNDIWFMNLALAQAEHAYKLDEVPVGAIIVDSAGKVIASKHNEKEKNHNPLGHCECLAIQEACKHIKNWRLSDCTLYVTLEPCIMCMGALSQSRIKKVVFGAYDKKGGALSLGYTINKEKKINHRFSIVGGVEHYKCSQILSRFFKEKRF